MAASGRNMRSGEEYSGEKRKKERSCVSNTPRKKDAIRKTNRPRRRPNPSPMAWGGNQEKEGRKVVVVGKEQRRAESINLEVTQAQIVQNLHVDC